METILKKPEIKRDPEGRFEQHGAGLKKRSGGNKAMVKAEVKKAKKFDRPVVNSAGGGNLTERGPGRPKGSLNRVTQALKDMILGALDDAGGREYLKTLAIENSSAFAGLIGKVLPTTLAAAADSGPPVIRFERVIVMPDGRKYVEGEEVKALPAPEYAGATGYPTLETTPESSQDMDDAVEPLDCAPERINLQSDGGVGAIEPVKLTDLDTRGTDMPPVSHTLPSDDDPDLHPNDIKHLD